MTPIVGVRVERYQKPAPGYSCPPRSRLRQPAARRAGTGLRAPAIAHLMKCGANGRARIAMHQLIGTVVLAVSVLVTPAAAAERVDLELVLLADASGSIDDAEIFFQRQGYAAAITHPAVLDAIAQGYDQRIAVTYVEWGGVSSQEVVVRGRSSMAPTARPRSPGFYSRRRGARLAATQSATRSRSARG
jgi:Protein of unknown function (DUF1194)